MPADLPVDSRVFGAIYRALEAEGFSKDETYKLAQRGAELLTDPNAATSSAALPADSPSHAAMPQDSALAALPDDLGRNIDQQTNRLEGMLQSLGTILGIVAVSIFASALIVSMVLFAGLDR